jgi:hypothetical protein
MKSNGNCVQCDSKCEDRVPVQKPNSFPEKLQSVHLSSFIADESPEMQVVVNATSPVIYRRSRQREKIKVEINNQQNEEDSNVPPEVVSPIKAEVVSPIKEENNCQKNAIKNEQTGKMKKVDSKSKHSKNSFPIPCHVLASSFFINLHCLELISSIAQPSKQALESFSFPEESRNFSLISFLSPLARLNFFPSFTKEFLECFDLESTFFIFPVCSFFMANMAWNW